MVCEAADAFAVEPPDVFVRYDPAYGARTLGTNEGSVVVLHSALVDAFQPHELAFVVGHEIAHIHNEHVTLLTIPRLLAMGAGAFAPAVLSPLMAAINAWSREAELTADRGGYLIAGDPRASVSALLMFAVGSRKLLADVDILAYLSQEAELHDFYGKINLWLAGGAGYEHPYLVVRVRQLIEFVRSPTGKRLADRLSPLVAAPRTSLVQPEESEEEAPPGGIRRALPEPPYAFCPQCGFEIDSGAASVCPVCGSRPEAR
jgi:Zn-dependent protease with chaperone function